MEIKMKKYLKGYLAVWLIFVVVFNLVCFLTPNEAAGFSKFGGAFWAGYIFIMIAFIGQLVCGLLALSEKNKTRLLYKLPMLKISYTGLVLTLIFGTLCMVIPNIPNWIGIVLCMLVLLFNVVAVIKAATAAEMVAEKDEQLRAQTALIKMLVADSQTLMANAGSEEIKDECRKVFEAVRYSDPMSNDGLADIEEEMQVRFKELEKLVAGGNLEAIKAAVGEYVQLVNQRNARCKALK